MKKYFFCCIIKRKIVISYSEVFDEKSFSLALLITTSVI